MPIPNAPGRVRREAPRTPWLVVVWILIAAFAVTPAPAAAAPAGSLAARIDARVDRPPFDRATWAMILCDSAGRVLYERNADRLMVPASTNKMLVSAAALELLGPSFRTTTRVFGTAPIANGVLRGDLVVQGGGDPTYSAHCYGTGSASDTGCDSVWTGLDALADALVARGLRRVDGALVGDGSAFESKLVHPGWEGYDLNWWYACPISALGFNDNSIDITWKPGPSAGAPPSVSFHPDLGLVTFENRGRTTPAGTPRNLEFYRKPGTMVIWSEGDVPLGDDGLTEYFALPDPNAYFAEALRSRLKRRGVTVTGGARSTTDSTRYAAARRTPALATRASRPVSDLVYPILDTSQNGFAETLLKLLGRERGAAGSWDEGLRVERRFLIDRVGIDSTAFATADGSGLSRSNLVTPRALTQLLRHMRGAPGREAFLRAMPRSGSAGSLRRRFTGTPLEGRVVAKTGSVDRVSTLAGYIERPRGGPLVFAVMVNNYPGPAQAQIDSVVVEMGR